MRLNKEKLSKKEKGGEILIEIGNRKYLRLILKK